MGPETIAALRPQREVGGPPDLMGLYGIDLQNNTTRLSRKETTACFQTIERGLFAYRILTKRGTPPVECRLVKSIVSLQDGGKNPPNDNGISKLTIGDKLSLLEENARLQAVQKAEETIGRVLEANLEFVPFIANRYKGLLEFPDLVEEGNLGLLKAVAGFDWRRGNAFLTFAGHWVKQSIQRAIIEKSHTIRVPSHVAERVSQLNRATGKLAQEFGRDPTPEETASKLGWSLETLSEISSAFTSRQPVSLNMPVGENGEGELSDFTPDTTNQTPEDHTQQEELRRSVIELLDFSTLSSRERRILELRFGLNGESSGPQTLEHIGRQFGVTRERIRQLEEKAFGKLRQFAQNNPELLSRLKELLN